MKTFTEYFMQLKPKYEFVARIAGCDLNEDMRQSMSSSLEMFVVENMGQPRRLPIKEHTDFLGMGPCHVHIVEFQLKYPTTTDQLRTTIARSLALSNRNVVVRTQLEEQNHDVTNQPPAPRRSALLTDPDISAESAQALVGNQRTESMLKELQTRKYEFAAQAESARDQDMPQSTKSPVGSQQNKIKAQ